MDEELDQTQGAPSGGGFSALGCAIQGLTHTLAIGVGVVIGLVGVRIWENYTHPELAAMEQADLSRPELLAQLAASEKAYQDLMSQFEGLQGVSAESAKNLTEAKDKVVKLEGAVAAKQEEVQKLEAALKKSKGSNAALKKELEAKQAELTSLETQLTQAQEEKAQLMRELVVSRQETQTARQETYVAKEESLDAQWESFRANAVMVVCEKGGKRKMDRCKEEVGVALNETRARRYRECIQNKGATPRLMEVSEDEGKDVKLPRSAEWLDQNSSFTEDRFYIRFCDPSLPEAKDTPSAPNEAAPANDPLEGLPEEGE